MSAVTRRLAALGCVGLLASTVAACGSSTKTGTSSGKPALTMGAVRTFSSLDPANAYDDPSWTIYYNIYQNLMSYQPGASTPSPDAAQKCGFNGNLTVYSCTLRSGLKFTNGDTLDAAAVKYSFDRQMKINPPDKATSGPGPLVANIASVGTQGSLGVVFHLKAPDAAFPGEIAGGAGSIVDPKVFPADKPYNGTSPVGSGVYKVDSAEQHTINGQNQGQSITLSVNPDYKGAATTPQNSKMTVRYFDTSTAMMQALSKGKIDFTAADLSPQQVTQAQNNQQIAQGVQITSGPGTSDRLLMFDLKDKPFTNVYVRRAVASLIDSKALATGVQQGQADPLYSIIPSGIGGHTTPFADEYNGPNVNEARQYLSDAGVSTPVSFSLAYAQNSTAGDAEAAEVKKQLENGGLFKVTLNPLHDVNALTGANGTQSDKLPAFLGNWYADYPDPSDYVLPLMGAYNQHYNNSQIVNKLLPAAAKQADRLNTNQIFAQVQQTIAKDAPMVPLWQGKQYLASQADVVGLSLTVDTTNQLRFWLVGKSGS
ncbi:ABC transporter substrate-binding protein [Phaeacidiphilus oryzae]|uniref:ABC transporter substrate-binding protein n=1 Tax=Phaeacidiphilus oryzae TaxID=348818 RepID=UPI000A0295E7|nr:ABC transporter substrate-binding protein [Phaeacidiphilus oryzae]